MRLEAVSSSIIFLIAVLHCSSMFTFGSGIVGGVDFDSAEYLDSALAATSRDLIRRRGAVGSGVDLCTRRGFG